MKNNYIHTIRTIALLGVIVAGLWGCQNDDLAEQIGAQKGEWKLTVKDDGYTKGQVVSYDNGTLRELPQTRATENGYRTTFTAGDKIGFYAVKNDRTIAENVCLTLTDIGEGKLEWQLPKGVKLPDADRFFAYYPYQETLTANVFAGNKEVDGFFLNVISEWKLNNDQSGTNYTKQDLMVGIGELDSVKREMKISLTHKMGLAVIKLPNDVKDVTFIGFTPYSGVSGEYRYLIKPKTKTTLKGGFTNSGENQYYQTYDITAEIEGGNYKKYTVSTPTTP